MDETVAWLRSPTEFLDRTFIQTKGLFAAQSLIYNTNLI